MLDSPPPPPLADGGVDSTESGPDHPGANHGRDDGTSMTSVNRGAEVAW